MKLHNDKSAFEFMLNTISNRTGIRSDIVEKDYYVTLMLKELSEKQANIPAYFKGGTALYKALGSIRRFSEDIDLTVEIRDCNNTQAKKRIERVSKKYTSLPRTNKSELETDKKGSITSVYEYEPISKADLSDPLQRFRYVKVEATSFTVSEPFEETEISPVVYQFANEQERKTLKEVYDIEPFTIKTISIERIFADKIFAAEFYYAREEYFDVAKHIYDITVMMEQERIIALLNDTDELIRMIGFKRQEESRRIGSDLADKPINEFSFWDTAFNNERFADTFITMQNIYVFNKEDRIALSESEQSIKALKNILYDLNEELEPITQDEENDESMIMC